MDKEYLKYQLQSYIKSLDRVKQSNTDKQFKENTEHSDSELDRFMNSLEDEINMMIDIKLKYSEPEFYKNKG